MQYSLKSMMILFFVIAFVCGLTFALPRSVAYAILGAILLMVPSCLVTGIVFGGEDQRAFSIGATATFVMMIWTNGPLKNLLSLNGFIGVTSLRAGTTFTVIVTFLIVGAAGAVAVWTRRRIISQPQPPKPPQPPA